MLATVGALYNLAGLSGPAPLWKEEYVVEEATGPVGGGNSAYGDGEPRLWGTRPRQMLWHKLWDINGSQGQPVG